MLLVYRDKKVFENVLGAKTDSEEVPGLVVHFVNPSYYGGRNGRIASLKPAQ
jgi:hypothetical protein